MHTFEIIAQQQCEYRTTFIHIILLEICKIQAFNYVVTVLQILELGNPFEASVLMSRFRILTQD